VNPKPPSFLSCPKPKRLEKSRRMTICIGIVAGDGVVIAADRQASAGPLKGADGKIATTTRADPFGTLVVTAAGDGAYCDAASSDMREDFAQAKKSGHSDVGKRIESKHVEFYKNKVLPCPDPILCTSAYESRLVC
jgi:hypothetical protein